MSTLTLLLGSRRLTTLASAWALGGVLASLLEAALRLGLRGVENLGTDLSAAERAWTCGVVVLFVYVEGYRALHRRFVPFVIARLSTLPEAPAWCWGVAPLYAAGLVGASRQVMARAWAGVAAIVAAIWVMGYVPPVARGMIDCGVAAALTVGCLSLGAASFKVLRGAGR